MGTTGETESIEKNGEPLEKGPLGTPVAWFQDGVWFLLYERNDQAVWLTKSIDMKQWTNVKDSPVLRPGPEWYNNLIAANQIIKYQGVYYLYYHGRGDTNGKWTVNIARSRDLINWEKYKSNPLLPLEANQSSGFVVHDGQHFRLYTTHEQVNVYFQK